MSFAQLGLLSPNVSARLGRMAPADRWHVLAALILARMKDLNLHQAGLVQRSGVSDPVLRELTGTGRDGVVVRDRRPQLLSRLSEALGWTPDSIERILAGGEPELLDPASHDQPTRADLAALIDEATDKILGAVVTAADADALVADTVAKVAGEVQRAATTLADGLSDVRDRLLALEATVARLVAASGRSPRAGQQRR